MLLVAGLAAPLTIAADDKTHWKMSVFTARAAIFLALNLFVFQFLWAAEMETKPESDLSLTIDINVESVRVGQPLELSLTLRNNQSKGLRVFQHDANRKPYVLSVQDADGIELVALNTKPVPRSRGMKAKPVYLEPNGVYTIHDTLMVTADWLGTAASGANGLVRYIVATYSVARSDSGVASEIMLLRARSNAIEVISKAAR